jgi:CubicO group peptidase (beta-lactamase class C family)
MEEFVKQDQVSGVVTLVAREGKIVHLSAVGQADIAGKKEMAADAIFGIASMTKPITATAVMILVDEGKLALDDPVSKYIPEFKDVKLADGKAPTRPPTIRDMLTHTSGLTGSQENVGTLEETGKALAARGLSFQPGEKWEYSPGLSVCGRAVEVASGMPYEKFLDERIFKPLGMSDTTFFPSEDQQKRIVKLYRPDKDGKLEETTHWITKLSPDRTANPSGGLFSTAQDLARFYQMLLNGGEYGGQRTVSAESIAELTKVQTDDLKTGFTDGNGWGLGVCVIRQPQGVTALLSPGSFGHGGAFGTQGWLDPTRQMFFVLLIQRTNFGNSDASEIRGKLQELGVGAIKVQ